MESTFPHDRSASGSRVTRQPSCSRARFGAELHHRERRAGPDDPRHEGREEADHPDLVAGAGREVADGVRRGARPPAGALEEERGEGVHRREPDHPVDALALREPARQLERVDAGDRGGAAALPEPREGVAEEHVGEAEGAPLELEGAELPCPGPVGVRRRQVERPHPRQRRRLREPPHRGDELAGDRARRRAGHRSSSPRRRRRSSAGSAGSGPGVGGGVGTVRG